MCSEQRVMRLSYLGVADGKPQDVETSQVLCLFKEHFEESS